MPIWVWATVTWALSAPIALWWTRERGFLPRGDPILIFRIPAVIYLAFPIALTAALVAAVSLVAAALRKKKLIPGRPKREQHRGVQNDDS